jgi:H+-transporting ATPase
MSVLPNLEHVAHEADAESGLSAREVAERRAQYGFNEIPELRRSAVATLGKHFWGIVPWMLEFTAILTFLLGKYPETVIVVALLLFNAAIAVVQERRASRAMTALKQRLVIQSRVKRDGAWSAVPARELVPGDFLRVRAGDLLPADATIVDGEIAVDQSALTGESVALERTNGALVYSGSAVTRGEAFCSVSATGAKTYFGRTVQLVKLAQPKLHMQEMTMGIARRLAVMVLVALLIAFAYASLTGFPLAVLVPLAAVLLIASVPVAMPAMFTLSAAMGSSMLAKKGVLVTTLSATEDAATMDVLCIDKTGTLTVNRLAVEQQLPFGAFAKDDVLFYGVLASNEANQDPIDRAFLTTFREAGLSLDGYVQSAFVPFDTATRTTSAVIEKAGERFTVTKGSFAAVTASCALSDTEKARVNDQASSLATQGLRAIAIAKGDGENRRLVGLAGLADKVRDDSSGTIAQLRDFGVSVKMLTGDALPIAENVAAQTGLGDHIVRMSDLRSDNATTIERAIEESSGIAEIYPEDKYVVVTSLQKGGHVVGMTGDGFNDAPALKQAEVGIAVSNATDVAKEAASAVLVTEGLAGIIATIRTGRTIYQRIFGWVLNMITMKTQLAAYVVVALFLTHHFVISVVGMVMLVFLTDFTMMSVTMDNVRFPKRQPSFDISRLFWVGLSIGLLSAVEGVALTIWALSNRGLGSNLNQLYTFGFAYLVVIGIFNLLVVRERAHFWRSRPSNFLLGTMSLQMIAVIAISLFGFYELAPLGYATLLTIIGYAAAVAFLLNDQLKVFLLRRLLHIA